MLKRRRSCFGSKIKVLSPAKINLYLNITGKYPGGYHRIESIVERVSLFDRLTIELTKNQSIDISSNIISLNSKRNLCYKAASILKSKLSIPYGFKISLNKKIPIGSGLGGGSSNAASVILGILALLKLRLEEKELFEFGQDIGSDVNFFLSQARFARLSGRGELVEDLKIKKTYQHYIIWPGFGISTRDVYSSKRAKLTNIFNNANILQYALGKGLITLLKDNIYNALEERACLVSKDFIQARNLFFEKNISAFMTGSGSAFFTIDLKNYHDPESSLSRIKKIIPKKWSLFRVQTF
ncbi:MAG: 4-(cytidine 5'-diphospho)-2-C-methyl-D-erythritol kinase [Candidatus Omnitrophica bacterium]|nr:4-(cytidine 5'-diphospho)-2-C-methyl-D-erythritol kinase [Candidatus Omnitrophota bacterium]